MSSPPRIQLRLILGLQEMQDALRHSVQALHSSYAAYTVDTPSEWLEAVDRNAVRQVDSVHCLLRA